MYRKASIMKTSIYNWKSLVSSRLPRDPDSGIAVWGTSSGPVLTICRAVVLAATPAHSQLPLPLRAGVFLCPHRDVLLSCSGRPVLSPAVSELELQERF